MAHRQCTSSACRYLQRRAVYMHTVMHQLSMQEAHWGTCSTQTSNGRGMWSVWVLSVQGAHASRSSPCEPLGGWRPGQGGPSHSHLRGSREQGRWNACVKVQHSGC